MVCLTKHADIDQYKYSGYGILVLAEKENSVLAINLLTNV